MNFKTDHYQRYFEYTNTTMTTKDWLSAVPAVNYWRSHFMSKPLNPQPVQISKQRTVAAFSVISYVLTSQRQLPLNRVYLLQWHLFQLLTHLYSLQFLDSSGRKWALSGENTMDIKTTRWRIQHETATMFFGRSKSPLHLIHIHNPSRLYW